MDTHVAADLINNDMAFWPNWRFSATPVGDHFVHVEVDIDTVDTSYPDTDGRCRKVEITLARDFRVDVRNLDDAQEFCYAVLDFAAGIHSHEDREALKIRQSDGSWVAPLHPHTRQGTLGWLLRRLASAREDA